MIQTYALTKRFGSLEVLRNVDLRIGPGRVTGIIGPNGAGKTTLIKTVLGLTRPTSGEVWFDGAPVRDSDAFRARVGYLPQIARFPENSTAAQLFALLRDLRGNTRPLDEDLIDGFRLGESLDRPLRVLSGGTRQKVNAALAFYFSPDALILDEPTAGLDPLSSAMLKDKILDARRGGRTVVIASHIMSELEEVSDDVVFLLDGTVHFAGAVHDIKVRTRQVTLERAVAALMLREVA